MKDRHRYYIFSIKACFTQCAQCSCLTYFCLCEFLLPKPFPKFSVFPKSSFILSFPQFYQVPILFHFFSCFEISVLQHTLVQARCLSKLAKKGAGRVSPLLPASFSNRDPSLRGQTLGKHLMTPAPSHSTENSSGWTRASKVIWSFCSGTKIPQSPNQKQKGKEILHIKINLQSGKNKYPFPTPFLHFSFEKMHTGTILKQVIIGTIITKKREKAEYKSTFLRMSG